MDSKERGGTTRKNRADLGTPRPIRPLKTESLFPLLNFCENKLVYQQDGPKFGSRNKALNQTKSTHNRPFNFRPGCRIFNDLRVVYRLQIRGCLLQFWWLISVCLAFTRVVIMKNISICGDQITLRLQRAILCCNQNAHYKNWFKNTNNI